LAPVANIAWQEGLAENDDTGAVARRLQSMQECPRTH
jgi:hypothetical protein